MPRPRKRKRGTPTKGDFDDGPPAKKERTCPKSDQCSTPLQAQHVVLHQFYSQVLTLRNYVLSKLPATSRLRRKKVAAIGMIKNHPGFPSDVERSLGILLDSTLVGVQGESQGQEDHLIEGWKSFSQKGDESYVTLSDGVGGFVETQALLLEYVVRTLFAREKVKAWPKHLLCNGFSRNRGLGLRQIRPNPHFEMLKQQPWPQLLALMGESGERIMMDLLLDCAMFVPVKAGENNLCQISAPVRRRGNWS
ncbi:hypothetical protein F5Y05DRAFT_208243 [Hypoxylon sp. FL0543]|nr:hypothetical protein F5Y05DRAFT_208243 [Hypoxylon sp. FL0543]